MNLSKLDMFLDLEKLILEFQQFKSPSIMTATLALSQAVSTNRCTTVAKR